MGTRAGSFRLTRIGLVLSVERGRPLGSDPWTLKMAGRMGLQYTLSTQRGRPSQVEKTLGKREINGGCHLNSFLCIRT